MIGSFMLDVALGVIVAGIGTAAGGYVRGLKEHAMRQNNATDR